MTRVQKIQLRQSELRETIGVELDKQIEEREDGGLERLTREAKGLETELRAALVIEQDNAIPDRIDTPEGRELTGLFARSALTDFVSETLNQQPLVGAPRELRQEILGGDYIGFVPLDLLLETEERIEQRADAVTGIAAAIQETQMPIAQRVFSRTATAYLGASLPSVAVGEVSFPLLSSGTGADVRSDGAELDGVAANLTTETISPVRLTSSYTFGVETLARVKGFEETLRRDLRGVIADKLDKLILRGQAADGNNSPAVEGIISALGNPSNPTATATWREYVTAYDGAVDGKFAVSDTEVRLLVNPATWRQAMGLTVGTESVNDDNLLRDILPRDRFRASANIPAAADGIATAVRYASGAAALARGMIAPVWRGLQLIIDPYSKAKVGQRVITAILITGFGMADPAAYGRIEFKLT